MPSPQRKRPSRQDPASSAGTSAGRVCSALTTGGQPCRRQAVAGLTVCQSHGGGTAASVRAGKRASVSQQAATLWGISTDTRGISVEEQLNQLARNKMTDVIALRLEISSGEGRHIGMLLDSKEVTETEVADDVFTTVKKKNSTGVSPWVQELHKAEQELLAILRLLQEVSGGSDDNDVRRIRLQTARETARLMKAFPGMGVDEVAAQVSKRAS